MVQRAEVHPRSTGPLLHIEVDADARQGGFLFCVLRPYNPEGVQFIEGIDFEPEKNQVTVNQTNPFLLAETPEKYIFSDYRSGDVVHRLGESAGHQSIRCDIGMATAAFGYKIPPGIQKKIEINVPLPYSNVAQQVDRHPVANSWCDTLKGTARLELPDKQIQHLFDIAKTTLVLLSTKQEIVPGPFTYRRFWFRDACLMLHALMNIGLMERCKSILASFPDRP